MRANVFIVLGSVVAASAVAPRAFARKPPLSEEAQRRALLEQLAAASAEIPAQEKTDADLMYEAMRQWRGEPRGSAAVDKVLAQSKSDIRHERKELADRVRESFWKDPFSSEVVPVRKEDRDLLHAHAARAARARGEANADEVARLRDALATARAENARLRAELSRLEESGGGGDVEAQAESVPPSRHLHARRSEDVRAHRGGSVLEAMSGPASTPVHHHHHAKPPARDAAVASAPPEAPATPPAAVTGPPPGWQSSDPRGIIVVPIETPVSIHADKPAKRAR
jgi:hypothetical protein